MNISTQFPALSGASALPALKRPPAPKKKPAAKHPQRLRPTGKY